jgi:integrase
MSERMITGLTQSDDYRRMSDELIDLHLAALEAAGRPPSTIEARNDVLRRLSRRLDYGLVYAAREQIEGWLADLRQRGRARATISIYAYHTRAFFDWACVMGFLDGNPTGGMEKPKMPRGIPNPITETELAVLLGLAEPLLTAIILGAFEGQRRAEIVACRREHITEDVVRIPRGKGGDAGAVPTHPFVWEHVRDRPGGLLVTDRRGNPVTAHWLGVHARYAFDALGLPDVHLHRLRDRYGTVIQEQYGDLRVTQECLRHRSVSSTEKYTLVTSKRRAAAVATLPVPTKTVGPAAL